jgi:CHAT domain-containing protein
MALRDPDCLDAETVAAFVDGTLAVAERECVETHLARCGDCYEAVCDVMRALERMDVGAMPVRAARVQKPNSTLWTILASAALVILAIGIARWALRGPASDRAMAELVHAVGESRPTMARLSTPFPWAPPPSADRSTVAGKEVSPEIQIAAAHIEQLLSQQRTARNLQAFATAQLVLGKPAAAIGALEEATHLSPSDPQLWTDLSAAYHSGAMGTGDKTNVPKALEAADRALHIDASSPPAWFNKALALEQLNVRDQALAAWKKYLAIDSNSPWAAEARQHVEHLQKQASSSAGQDAQGLRDAFLDEVWPRWAATQLDVGSTPRMADLHAAHVAALKLRTLSSDRFPTDLVQHVERLSVADAAIAARGFREYSNARRWYRADDYERASPKFDTAATYFAAVNSPALLATNLYRAILEYRRNDYAAAVADLGTVQTTARQRGYLAISGRAGWVRGLAFDVIGRPDDARTHYEAAVKELATAGELSNRAFVLGLLASLFDRLGDLPRAWESWGQALSADPTRDGTLLSAALSAENAEWHWVALDLEASAIVAARAGGRATTLVDALRLHAITAARLGEQDQASNDLRTARAIVEQQSGSAWERLQAELNVAEALSADRNNAKTGIVAATTALTYFRRANAVERLPELLLARARLRRQSGDLSGSLSDLQSGVNTLTDVGSRLAQSTDQMWFGDIVRHLVDETIAVEAARGHLRDAFDVLEQSRAPDLPCHSASVSLAQVQKRLPLNVTVVEFALGAADSHAWVVTRDAATVVSLGAGLDELRQLVGASGPPRFEEAAIAALGRVLVAPLDALLPRTGLLVLVPDGPLHAIPFGMLRGTDGLRLIEHHSIVVAASAGCWLGASERLATTPFSASAAAVIGSAAANTDAYRNLPLLPYADEEADEIAGLYPGATRFKGEHVTRSVVLKALDSPVVHFAGHAVVNQSRPSRSGLVVVDPSDSLLSSDEIRRRRCASCRLVVLATCASSAGTSTRTEGPISVARAFIAAGAQAVVASHWLVADRPSKELLVRFHREYRKSGNAADALRQAQLTMIHNADPILRLPRNWAAYSVFGGGA